MRQFLKTLFSFWHKRFPSLLCMSFGGSISILFINTQSELLNSVFFIFYLTFLHSFNLHLCVNLCCPPPFPYTFIRRPYQPPCYASSPVSDLAAVKPIVPGECVRSQNRNHRWRNLPCCVPPLLLLHEVNIP